MHNLRTDMLWSSTTCWEFLVVITSLLFCSYHIGLVIQGPDCPLRVFWFKLFISLCQEFLSSRQYPVDGHVPVCLLALVLNLPQRSCLGFYFWSDTFPLYCAGSHTLLGHPVNFKALANEDTLLQIYCFRHKCFPVCLRAHYLLRTQILCLGHKMILIFFRNILCPQHVS